MRCFCLDDVYCFLYQDLAVEMRVALRAELHCSRLEGVERVVFADADILAREDSCASLADNDRTSTGFFACVQFRSKIFWIRIS